MVEPDSPSSSCDSGYIKCRNIGGRYVAATATGSFREFDGEKNDRYEQEKRECLHTLQDLVSEISKEDSLQIPCNGQMEDLMPVINNPQEEMRLESVLKAPIQEKSHVNSSLKQGMDSVNQLGNASSQCDEKSGEEDVEKIIGRLKAAKDSGSVDGFVNELPNVQDFEREGWGAAVEIKNPAFYPTTVTCALENDEYQKFLQTSDEEGCDSENHKNVIQSSLVHEVEEGRKSVVCSNSTLNGDAQNGLENLDDAVNGEFPFDLYCGNVDIEDIDKLQEVMTSGDVLDYVLDEGTKSSEVLEIGPDVVPTSLTSTSMEVAEHESDDKYTTEDEELSESQITTEPSQTESDTSTLYERTNDIQQAKPSEPPSLQLQEMKMNVLNKASEDSMHNHSSSGIPKSNTSSRVGSVLDPRLRRRTRSTEESSSQVSFVSTSTSSFHSSIRPCSVVLTRLTPTEIPVQHIRNTIVENEAVNKTSPSSESSRCRIGDTLENVDLSKVAKSAENVKPMSPCSTVMSGTTKDTIKEITAVSEDEEPLSKPLMVTIHRRKEATSHNSAKMLQSNGPCAKETTSTLVEVVTLSDDEPDPILPYEPIGMDEASVSGSLEANVFETEVKQNCEENIVSPKSIRTTQKRKSIDKIDEAVKASKKSCVSSNKPLKNEGKSPGLMSKREIQNFVKRESRKAQPDFSRLSEAMNITYDQCRKTMYDKGQVEVEMLKKKYPELLHYKMVKEEIGRILSDTTKMDRLEKELDDEILPAALREKKKKASFPKKRHFLWEKTIKLWEENKESPDSLQYRRVLGMLAVCFEFAENAVVNSLCKVLKQNQILESKDTEKMATPTIVVSESELFSIAEESEIWIYVDGVKYLKVPNMYEAVLSVFAAYYIFNINYDSKLKSLFEFFDYLCDNQQTTYRKSNTKWPPPLQSTSGKKAFLSC